MSSDPIEVLRRMVEKLAAHVRPTCDELWEEAHAALASLSAPKPSPMNDNAVAVNEVAPVNDKPESAEAVAWISQSDMDALRGVTEGRFRTLPVWTAGGHDIANVPLYTAPPRPEASAPVGVDAKWPDDYCPECGSSKVHHREGEHIQCGNCHQEYFTSIDYSGVVRENLKRLFALAQQPAAVDCSLPSEAPVDEVMVRTVAKAINAELEGDENIVLAWKRLGSNERKLRDRMARAAIAALAAQQGGSDNDR